MGTLKAIRGKGGTLEFADGTTATCDFVIRQTSDAGLRLTCELDPKDTLRPSTGGASAPIRLIGSSSDGRPVELQGQFHVVSARGMTVTFVCSGASPLRLGPEPTSGGRLFVALTNCFFIGTNWVDLPDGTFYRGAIPLTIEGRLITLQGNRRAEEQRRNLRDTQGTAITARFTTDLPDAQDRHQALEAMRRLSFLLSLATGTLVSFPRWRLRNSDGRVIAAELGSPPMRPYQPRTLIDCNDGEALKRFLETAYPNFVAKDSIYQFPKAIHAKIDTTASGFLETRTLTASALIEYLSGTYARENGLQPPVQKAIFKSVLSSLKVGLDSLLKDVFSNRIETEDRQEMRDRVEWFNEPTLRRKLRFLVDGLNLPFAEDDLKAIRRTRNALVHRMRFQGDNNESPHKEWTRMIHFIDVTLLRLLGYRGPYIDCRTWDTAELA
jgi:hypothetical protein